MKAPEKFKSMRMQFLPPTKDGDEAILTIADVIEDPDGWCGYSSIDFQSDLRAVGSAARLRLVINSPGGSVVEALAIYDLIRGLAIETIAEVRGMAASAATIIALACKKIQMSQSSTWMIHEPTGGMFGNLAELKAQLKFFESLRSRVLDIYSARIKSTPEEVSASLAAPSYMTAEKALSAGWVDEVIQPADPEPTPEPEPEPEPETQEPEPEPEPETPEPEPAADSSATDKIDALNAELDAKNAELAAKNAELEALKMQASDDIARAHAAGRAEARAFSPAPESQPRPAMTADDVIASYFRALS